jgi:hypothetical protein
MGDFNQNEEKQSAEMTDKSYHTGFNWKRALVTAAFVFAAAGVVGGVTWYLMDQNEEDIKASNDKSTQEMQKTITNLKNEVASLNKDKETATDWRVYKNTQYGFQLTFPESWNGYKFYAQNIEGSAQTWYVELPTTDANYAKADSTHEAGYSSLFAISAYTQEQWTALQGEEGPKPTQIGTSGNYVFAYSPAQAGPSDISSKTADVKTIIATFKSL